MPTPEEELASLEEAMKRQTDRAKDLGKSLDELDQAVNPPRPTPDHANDGGVI